ncbi:MAG TPA: hypothetical protein EYQ50_07250 [Verrucomicrobiales bacterium]|nr:hypothetical protein [Verrucomicrobiales bacterium]
MNNLSLIEFGSLLRNGSTEILSRIAAVQSEINLSTLGRRKRKRGIHVSIESLDGKKIRPHRHDRFLRFAFSQ